LALYGSYGTHFVSASHDDLTQHLQIQGTIVDIIKLTKIQFDLILNRVLSGVYSLYSQHVKHGLWICVVGVFAGDITSYKRLEFTTGLLGSWYTTQLVFAVKIISPRASHQVDDWQETQAHVSHFEDDTMENPHVSDCNSQHSQ
jgi:hypothetical protein